MKDPDIKNDVLWLAIEDISGLWEVLWDLKSHYPTMSEAERKASAIDAVRELIQSRLIEVYSCREPAGDPKKMADSAVEQALLDSKNWQEPDAGAVSIRIGATDAGRRELTGVRAIRNLADFIPVFLERFPQFNSAYKREFDAWDEAPGAYNFLDIVVLPEIRNTLKNESGGEDIGSIFAFFEEVFGHSKADLRDLIGVAVCEDLCGDEAALQKAVRHMGKKTKALCDRIANER